MKRSIFAAICVVGVVSLVGCAKDHLILTNDGQLIETANKPRIDDDTGLIEYRDQHGRTNQIPQSDVSEIKER